MLMLLMLIFDGVVMAVSITIRVTVTLVMALIEWLVWRIKGKKF